MSDLRPGMHDKPSALGGVVGAKAVRKQRARRDTQGVWFGLGMMGLIGWSIVVPTLLGAALGIWLDARYPGKHAWTLALLVAGLVLGCANAWHWVARQERTMREQSVDDEGTP
jgi:ATP synthase protein I